MLYFVITSCLCICLMGTYWESFWLELGLIISALLVCLYFWVENRYRYFQERGIPYVKPTFLLGSTYRNALGLENMDVTFSRLYDQLGDVKIGGVFQYLTPTYVIRDPDVVQKVLVSSFSHFHSRGIKIDTETNPLDDHLFNIEGEKWRVLRNKLSPTFTSGKLKWMYPQMGVCGDALIGILQEELSKNEDIEVKDMLARFTTDVIGSCAFGFEPSAIKDKDSPFRVMGKKFTSPGLKQILVLICRSVCPDLFVRLKMKSMPDDITDFFFSIIDQTFKHRLATGEKRNDFVELLLQLKKKGSIDFDPKDEYEEEEVASLADENNEPLTLKLTDDILAAQAFVFFAAGFETSATSMSFALYLLAKNTDAQEKAREEIRQVTTRHGDKLSYEALKEMVYLDACFSESMRLMPPIPIHFRVCNKDLEVDGFTITKGTYVIVPVRSIHLNPEYWKEPDRFIPERFIEDKINPASFIPFGYGPRICIGRRFALLESKLCLAKILQSYSVTVSPRQKEPLEFEPWNFILQPKGGISLRFKNIT